MRNTNKYTKLYSGGTGGCGNNDKKVFDNRKASDKMSDILSDIMSDKLTGKENVMETPRIVKDEKGNKVVVLPDIIFSNKQNIDWDEYAGSKYTRKTKGARAKAKANAVQGIREMIRIASGKIFRENQMVVWWQTAQGKERCTCMIWWI